MESRAIWWRILVGAAFLLPVCGIGCCYLHPVVQPASVVLEPARSLPKGCKDHVYIFLANGLDPLDYGNLTGLRDYLQALGFHQTYYGQIYHYWWFKSEIRRLRREDPEAHFVLIGFSVGVNVMDDVAEAMAKEGIYIDLLVFLSGNHPVEPMPHCRPSNVGRVVNMLASGIMQTRGERDWAENHRPADAWHFDIPTHPLTLQELTQDLALVAADVPEKREASEPMPEEYLAPMPRPVPPRSPTRRDDWDFLKPESRGER